MEQWDRVSRLNGGRACCRGTPGENYKDGHCVSIGPEGQEPLYGRRGERIREN